MTELTMTEPTVLHVPVDGGDLAVAQWGSGERLVLAPHGITANYTSWAMIAAALPDDVTLLAPDLRGRGFSGELPGPYGMAAHARDLVAVLDHVGADRAVIAGHSMGGFVAAKMAMLFEERVSALVLIDGGLAVAVPEGSDIDAILNAVIGPAMARLGKVFPDRESYLEPWRAHPALGPYWHPLVDAYLDHDVHDVDGGIASRVSAEAVRGDGRDTLVDRSLVEGLGDITMPVTFVRAPRGLADADPLYPAAVVDHFRGVIPQMQVIELDDVNHYTLALAPHGAEQVAAAILASLDAVTDNG